jgi:SAM-dependent methyltransferase
MTYRGLVTITNSKQPHLGGNVLQGDPFTYSPLVWDYVVKRFCIESVLDLGSGIGYAAAHFHHMGLKVVAVEGAMANVTRSFYPAVCHDLSLGPVKTKVDLVHCQEVVEHVEARYLEHLLDSLATGRVILLTHALPGEGGHHHVNEQPAE